MASISSTLTVLSWVQLAVRLLPEYTGHKEFQTIESSRRNAQDLLEILACHQQLLGLRPEPEWLPIMEIAGRWWRMWLAAYQLEDAFSPSMPRTAAEAARSLANDIAGEFRQHGRQRVTAYFEWAMGLCPDYQRPHPLEDPAFWL
jgi:hypothetical protein